MPRPSNTDQRRSQITRALLKVMARQGYDGASVADVARAARLTPGLVHYHFENKQEILLSALRELSERHLAGLRARLAPVAGDPRAALDAFIDFHLGLGEDADPEALACWILLSGEALRQPKIQVDYEHALGALRAELEAIIVSGVAQRLFRCDSPPAAAAALLATIQGFFVLAGSARALIPRGSAALTTKRMASGLLGKPA